MNYNLKRGVISMDKSKNISIDSVNKTESLIAELNQARLEKNVDRIKEIRDSFKEQGIVLKYTPQGTRWRIENGNERVYKNV